MKTALHLLVLAGVALGYSTSYYGWTPSKEYIYHFESQILTGIPEIKSQYSGLKISSIIKIQSFPDYSLRIEFTKPRFITVNEELLSINGKLEVPSVTNEEVPEAIYKPLTRPFEVHMKRGVVESIFVGKDEPVVVVNMKKALVSQLQTDLSASRQDSVQRLNHVVLPQLKTAQDEMRNISFFSTMEMSLHGDCETDYTIHPIPLYQAREMEEQWRVYKIKVQKLMPTYSRMSGKELMKMQREAESTCENQQYYEIIKTRNFDNCRERPVFSSWTGISGFCDPSRSMCEDSMTHMSSTRYIVCGTPEQFVIRKVTTTDRISTVPLGWETKEKLETDTRVTLELMKVESSGYTPMNKLVVHKKKTNLFMEYPDHRILSSTSISEHYRGRSSSTGRFSSSSPSSTEYTESPKERELKTLLGYYPIHPMPEMNSAPRLLYPSSIPKPELYHQIKSLMAKIVKETYESPESCSSSSDVAGHIMALAKSLRPLSVDELKESMTGIRRHLETHDHGTKTTAKYLFFDILSMVGTNPSVVLMKELIDSQDISIEYAPQLLQSTLRNIRTPTSELFNLIFSMVKSFKSKSHQLYTVSSVSLSDLIYRACVNPTTMTVEFPTHIYGNFCNPDSSFIRDQWIPYLDTEIDNTPEKDSKTMVVMIHSLGKLGHYRAITPLSKVIQGRVTNKPLIRSLAVHALKRMALMYPSEVRSIVLTIIDNPAENTEVRIGAVGVLPYTSPNSAELQKIALRTWFEPSKQVSSFIYSTFKSLSSTDNPEHSHMRDMVKGSLSMIKPVRSGLQYSHNIVSDKLVEYLRIVTENGVKMVNTEESFIPSKISYKSNYINRSWKIKGLSFSVYNQGMDYVMDRLMTYTNMGGESSQSVRSELQRLDEKLQIQKREMMEPEAHVHMKFMGIERLFSFNTEFYMETIRSITEKLRNGPIYEGYKHKYTKAEKLGEIQITMPTDSGFPLLIEKTMPAVFSVRSSIRSKGKHNPHEESKYPSSVNVKLIPVVNMKVQSTMGVLSPFTRQYIGSGVELAIHGSLPLETWINYNKEGQISAMIRSPESIKTTVELLHMWVKPFTFKKSLHMITSTAHSSGSKLITSGETWETYETNGAMRTMGLDIPIQVKTDNPTLSAGSIINKIYGAPTIMSGIQTLFMPGTVRYTSIKAQFNPSSSTTKEIQFRLALALATKNTPSGGIKYKYPISSIHGEEIRKLCVENHQSEFEVNKCLEDQKEFIKSTADVSEGGRRFCKRQMRLESSHSEDELEHCLKSVKICEQANVVCLSQHSSTPSESSSVSYPKYEKICEMKKNDCQMRSFNSWKTESVLRHLESGYAASVSAEGSINTHYEKKTVSATLTMASRRKNLHVETRIEGELDLPTMSTPLFVESEINTHLPEVKNKWDQAQMVSDDLRWKTHAVIHYGSKSESKKQMKKATVELSMTKTESQKQSVKKSPEYTQCTQMEGQDRYLSPICEKVRHQASSIDKFVLKVKLPYEVRMSPLPSIVHNMLLATFYPNTQERVYDTNSMTSLENNEIFVEALFRRHGGEATIKYRHPGFEWNTENYPMPSFTRNILPLSVRNGLVSRVLQQMTSQQTPASCRIENQFVTTFDNRTYEYTLNDCEHLLVKDCSGTIPMGVTAHGTNGQKKLKIMVGVTVVELKPTQGSVINGIYVDGDKQVITPGQVFRKASPTTNREVLEIRCYLDGVVVVRDFETGTEVSFDGRRVEIVAPQTMRSRSCGLCGDLNGESTADLLTPKKCIFGRSRLAAYTYMVKDSCRGIPEQDKQEYEREVRECTKKVTYKTPLDEIIKRKAMVKSGVAGVVYRHTYEYRVNGNEICFSKVPLPICESGTIPVIGHMSSTPFTCMKAHSYLAKHIKNKVLANERVSELSKLPIMYSRMIEKVTGCRSPTKNTGYGDSSSGGYGDSSSGGYGDSSSGSYDASVSGRFPSNTHDYSRSTF